MKTGKTLKLSEFDNLKVSYGTVDFKNFKSMYLNIQSWLQPKIDLENWDRIVGNLRREIKHIIYEYINPNFFEENFIVDLDLRTSGIQYGKKSFMNLEITFYVKPKVNFKSTELKNEMRYLSTLINNKAMLTNKYFSCSLTKKLNQENILEYAHIYR